MNRRKALKTLAAIGTLTGLYVWQVEPFWLEFVKMKMPIKNLPNHLAGKTVMQISDLHVGNRFSRQYLIDSLRSAQAFEPDFVVYTGDYVSYESAEQFDQLSEVLPAFVKGKLGTVGILGNHDYGKNWRQPEVANHIEGMLTQAGVTMLRNAQTTVNGLTVIGLDDFWGTNFKPKDVIPTIDLQQPNLLLCHNPDVMDQPIWHNYDSWVLSGHTHGGQCKPPFLDAPLVPVKNKRYTAGQFDFEDGRTLYINRALGHLWQVRFNVRPEITVFTLEKA
jgi:uncharacterized protein